MAKPQRIGSSPPTANAKKSSSTKRPVVQNSTAVHRPGKPKITSNIPPRWKNQTETLAFCRKTPIVFDTSDAGTGKTRAHAEAFAERRKQGGGKALVLAPKTLLETAWQKDINTFCPGILSVVAYAENRREAFNAPADIYITNTDAVKWIAEQPASFLKGFDTLIIDESTVFKNRTSGRSKAMKKLKKKFTYRAGLSATAYTKTLLNLWHQAFILDDGHRLGKNFHQYRNAVCEPVRTGNHARAVDWQDKDGALEAVIGLLADINIRHRLEDCVDIPKNHLYRIDHTLPKKLKDQYDELAGTAILELENEDYVDAVNAAVMQNKLLQVASGAVYTDQGYKLLDPARYELILDLIEEREHSVCFFIWRHQKEYLEKHTKKRKLSYAIIDGTVPHRERTRIVEEYQAGRYQTLYLHPKTGAHGLTLTRGTATLWPSPIYEPDVLYQGVRRIYRGGQTQKTETILIQAKGTVEDRVFNILDGGTQRMTSFLNLLTSG